MQINSNFEQRAEYYDNELEHYKNFILNTIISKTLDGGELDDTDRNMVNTNYLKLEQLNTEYTTEVSNVPALKPLHKQFLLKYNNIIAKYNSYRDDLHKESTSLKLMKRKLRREKINSLLNILLSIIGILLSIYSPDDLNVYFKAILAGIISLSLISLFIPSSIKTGYYISITVVIPMVSFIIASYYINNYDKAPVSTAKADSIGSQKQDTITTIADKINNDSSATKTPPTAGGSKTTTVADDKVAKSPATTLRQQKLDAIIANNKTYYACLGMYDENTNEWFKVYYGFNKNLNPESISKITFLKPNANNRKEDVLILSNQPSCFGIPSEPDEFTGIDFYINPANGKLHYCDYGPSTSNKKIIWITCKITKP